MSDYISRVEARNCITGNEFRCRMIQSLDSIPSADVRENVHGEWKDSDIPGSILSKCSVCGFQLGAYSFNFCPKCGADMRGE